jgi:hypothetical protein
LSHRSVQKNVGSPFPSVNTVAAWNTATTARSRERRASRCFVRACHSHRTRRAIPARQRSETPRPPRSLGRQTVSHVTLHLPPVTVSDPHQMKARRSLSIDSTAHGDKHRVTDICVGMAFMVAFTKAVRPAVFSNFHRHTRGAAAL